MTTAEAAPEPVIPDEVIDRLELTGLGRTETDDLTRTVKELERLGAKFPPWFFDQPLEAVREGMKAAARSERVLETHCREQEADARRQPRICTSGATIYEMSEAALAVIGVRNSPPEIFARSTRLVRVAQDEQGGVYIQEFDEAGLTGVLDRLIVWYRVLKDGAEQPTRPPREAVRDILALPAAAWGVPALAGVTGTPIFHGDGTIHATPGYDEQTGLYYYPATGFALPPVPEVPTQEDVAAALSLIEEVFVDFPFVGEADRANVYGALLTAVLRPCIDGPVPLYLCDKPQAGSGAGLLQRAIGRIALGHEPPLRTMPTDQDMRKEIFASLRNGTRMQIFDNLEDKLSSPELAAAVTAVEMTGRILGQTEERTYPVQTFWMANGNNVAIGGDLARRTFKTRIDPQVATPWQREGFKHPDILAWIGENRSGILAAIFTLARAWVQAGKPAPRKVPRVGSFEAWRDTVGGTLEHVGAVNFMANADEVYLGGDADRIQWEAFLQALWDFYGCNSFTAGSVASLLGSEDPSRRPLLEAMPDDLAESFQIKKGTFSRVLGKAFAKIDGRHFPTGYCLTQGKWSRGIRNWVITYMEPAAPSQNDVVCVGCISDLNDSERIGQTKEIPPVVSTDDVCGVYSYNATRKEKVQNTHIDSEQKQIHHIHFTSGKKDFTSSVGKFGGENSANEHTPLDPRLSFPPIPPGCLKHPIEVYTPRKYDRSIVCMVPGCRRHAKYAAGAGFPLCEEHYQAAKRQAEMGVRP